MPAKSSKACNAPGAENLSEYEPKRAPNTAVNAGRMKAMGVAKAAVGLGKPIGKKAVAARKNVAAAAAAAASSEPTRKSARAVPTVSYKEPSATEFEAGLGGTKTCDDKKASEKAAASSASRGGYKPSAPKIPFAASLDSADGSVRDSETGALKFKDHPSFTPNLTPKQVIQAGTWGGVYFNPRGGKAGIKGRDVQVTHAEFPSDWFAGLKTDQYAARRYQHTRNKYLVKAGQDQAFWEQHGWINDQDPRGWFQWYCRFFAGRRTEDDARQIARWSGVAGAKGRWKTNLCKKCVFANKCFDDVSVSPVIRQTMLHWAYEITERDVVEVMKRM